MVASLLAMTTPGVRHALPPTGSVEPVEPTVIDSPDYLMGRDLGVTEAVRTAVPHWSVDLFSAITMFGSLELVLAVLGTMYLLDLVLAGRSGGRWQSSPSVIFLIAAVFGGLSLVVVLKATFGLPRPPPELMAVDRHGYGFPSGHTMAATVLWGGLARWIAIGTRNRRYAIAGLIIGAVAVSRMALGVHYMVDVIASVLFGVGYLLLIERLTAGQPTRTFGIAIGIAMGAVLVAGLTLDAVLALAGTVLAFIGWRTVDRLGSHLRRS